MKNFLLVLAVMLYSVSYGQYNSVSPFDVDPIPDDRHAELFYEGQLCHWVRCAFEDSRGVLWFGTNHYGVMRYDGESLQYFTERQGFGNSRVSGIVEDRSGCLWFATGNGLTRYDHKLDKSGEEPFTLFGREEGMHNQEVWTITVDQNGNIWIGTTDGVQYFDPLGESIEFKTLTIPQAQVKEPNPIIAGTRISGISEDRNGNLWFSTDGYGLCKYNPKAVEESQVFTLYTKKDGLPDNNVNGVLEDGKGNLWIGSMFGGVTRYDPNKQGNQAFTSYTQHKVLGGIETGGMYLGKDGKVWISVEHQGVYRYDPVTGAFELFNQDQGLETGGIITVLEDSKGRFWWGGWKGLFRYYPKNNAEEGAAFVRVTKAGPWEP